MSNPNNLSAKLSSITGYESETYLNNFKKYLKD